MASSKLTSKYQATIPEKIRKHLGLKKGDRVAFTIRRGVVTLQKGSPIDLEYVRALEGTLCEWESESDEKAYRDL